MQLEIKLAKKRGDVLRCQYLIAEAYNRFYEIFFSRDLVNPNARIEPYPDRYLMGLIDGEVVATAGLYLQYTYCARYGDVKDEEIDGLLNTAGVADRYTAKRKREYTKLVIRQDWEGRGLGTHFFKASHSRDFLFQEASEPYAITCCAKQSIYDGLYRSGGIQTRLIKPFPVYEVHSLYSSAEDPMQSRLVIPDLDIPKDVFEQKLPMAQEFVPTKGGNG